MKNEKCLVCESKEINVLTNFALTNKLVKCNSCKFVFMQDIPSAEELNAHYAVYSYQSHLPLSPATKKSYNLLLDEFEKYRSTNKILDLGCGRGWFLIEAKKRGWEVFGTEYSETAVKVCESEGLKVVRGALTASSFNPEEFDVITSFEVIEHINNPNEDISFMKTFLRKGGLFYCTTPNFNSYLRYYLKEKWDMIHYPEHLSYYTKKSMKFLLKKHGFETKKIMTTGISIGSINISSTVDAKTGNNVNNKEKIREKISNNLFLTQLKKMANFFLSWLGIGMTLKGYFEKTK